MSRASIWDPASALFLKTPVIYSHPLSRQTGKKVYLKLDALQPTGSFKDRGLSRYCQYLKESSNAKHLICSSGGNAGHAVAAAGRALGVDVSVVVPTATSPAMADKIRAQGAKVIVHGNSWPQADALAREIVAKNSDAQYVTPFDEPIIWDGHSTMVDEIKNTGLSQPSAFVTCVGGGGLLAGLYIGLERVGWQSTSLIAAETEGAASFALSCKQGKRAKLNEIKTIATTLGAPEVSQGVLDSMKKHPGQTTAVGDITDMEAVRACLQFQKDHRMLVEPACGAALSILYEDRHKDLLSEHDSIMAVVCGGGDVDIDRLVKWKNELLG